MQYRQQRHPPTAHEKRRSVFTPREKEAAAQRTTDHAAMPYPTTATGRAKVARQQTTSAGEYDADDDYDDVVSPHVAAIVPRYNRIPTADGYIEKRGNQHMHVHFVDTPSQVARASRTTTQAPEQRPTRWEKPRRRFHWLFFVGIALLVMLMGYVGFGALGSWWHIHQDDSTYGRPRTFQIDAVVGHHGSSQNPTHFIALNLSRHILIIEIPGGDVSKSLSYSGPTLMGDGQDLVPVTLTFQDVNGDGRLDMLVHIEDQIIVFLNNSTKFVAPTQSNTPGGSYPPHQGRLKQ